MAKFTTSRPLAMQYQGHDLTGPPGTVFRIPDSLRPSFIAEHGTQMPDLTWVPQDEIATGGGEHPDLSTHDALGLATDVELSAHDSDTNAHVYFALDADLANHEADTTNVHGIADTANISLNGHTHAGGGGEAFPVGSIFLSVVTTNPATLLGYGTWSAFAAGRMLLGFNTGDIDEATGGASTHGHAMTQASDHAALTHSGGSVSQHSVTQPVAANESAHTHTYTQVPNHVHVQNVNSATTGGLSGYTPDTSTNTSTASGYSTANPTGGVATGTTAAGAAHTHTLSGAAVADHSFTQPSNHAAQAHSGASVTDGGALPPYVIVHMWKRTA